MARFFFSRSDLRKKYGQFITSGAQLAFLFFVAKSETPQERGIFLALIAIVSLLAWISTQRRRRALLDTPTSRIASAAQGVVELCGHGKLIDPPLLSRACQRPCLWYRCEVEERTSDQKWEVVERDESKLPFIIDDGSGECLVEVEDAEILTHHKERRTEENRRVTEWKLLAGDMITVFGEFRTLRDDSVFDGHELVGEILGEWKKDQAALLRRFDLDGDGQINEKEWNLARQAARREAEKRWQERQNEAELYQIGPPADGRCYLVSNFDRRHLARRYLLWSAFHLLTFLAMLIAIPVVL